MSTKATQLSLKAKEAFIQYSKKMCTGISAFWMAYRLIVSLLIFFKPDISNALIYLTNGVDTVMIANISVYTGNSICEKGFIAFGKRSLYNPNEDTNDEKKSDEDEELG